MKHTGTLITWIVTGVAIIAAGLLGRHSAQLGRGVSGLLDEMAAAQQEVAQLLEAQREDQAAHSDVVEQLSAAETQLKELRAELAAAQAAAEAEPEAEPEAESTKKAKAAEEKAKRQKQARGLQRVQTGAMVDMGYGTFFDERGFSAEVQAEVRDSLVSYSMEAQKLTQAALRKGRPAKEFKRDMDAAAATLRDELKEKLSREELAAWDEYEPYADQYMYENLVDGQLTMLAPKLSPENRETARVVIAQEVAGHLEALENSDWEYNAQNFFDAQENALNASVERLSEIFDAEQLAHIERFRDIAVQQFRALTQE